MKLGIYWKKALRRTISMICAVCIVFSAMSFSAGAKEQTEEIQYETIEISQGTLIAKMKTNVRQGPGTEHTVLAEMAPGDICEVLGREGDWYHIDYDGVDGYISAEYLSVETIETKIPLPTASLEPTPVPTAMPGYELVRMNIGTVISQLKINVRTGPGTEHDVINRMKPGDTCVVLDELEGLKPEEMPEWYHVEIEGETGKTEGYVAAEYLEVRTELVQVPIATPTPVPTETPAPEPTETPAPTAVPAEATVRPSPEPGYEWVDVLVGKVISQTKTNIRKGPGTGHDIVGHVSNGDQCAVLGEENGWYQIKHGTYEGYVAKEYIEVTVQATQMPIATPTPVPTETPVPAETVRPGYEMKEVLVGTVISEANTSVRQGPGTEYGAVTYLAPGRTCIVLDEHMEWYKIQYEDVIGYIANEYLSVAEMTTQVPIATPTPVPTEMPDVSRTAAPGYEFVEQKIGTVNSQININVREGAGTRYDTLMQLAPGESRVVLGEEGDWYRLDLNGRIGYAAKEYITISTQLVEAPIASKKPEATGAPTASAQETLRPGYEWVERIEGTLNAQKETNVRKGPGTDYDVLTQMNPGQTCRVLGEENGWYRIEFNGQRGYILKDYISTRSYREQVEIVEEGPLDAELFNLSAPHALERRGSFTLRGVIYSNIPLTGVKLTVYNLRSMTEEMTTTVSFHHDEGITEYDLVELDGDMRFGRLTAGEKRMTITATSRDDVQVLDEIEFTVLGEADEEVSMTDACGFTASIGRADRVTDRKYSTAWMPERVGEMLIITVPQSKEADTITIEWETAPSSFELIMDGTVLPVENEKEMLHFNFAVHGAKEIKIRATDKKAGICEIRVYEAGAVPTVVEKWQPAGDQVDMMVVAAHPGDEFLFFGGAIPHAAAEGKSVLVVYAADCGRERMAEAMDGLWAVGVTTHPVCLGLKNGNPDDVEEAMDMWGLEDTYELMTETIRKYKPAVVLSHDINGEDEDPQHKLTSTTLRRALLLATDPDTYPASVSKYGVWNISKAYIHRYEGNVLTFDADLPLAMLNGATLREMTMIGFNKHAIVADDFDLEDGERYDPYSYGLILTNVEADDVRKDSFFENIGENAEETAGQ